MSTKLGERASKGTGLGEASPRARGWFLRLRRHCTRAGRARSPWGASLPSRRHGCGVRECAPRPIAPGRSLASLGRSCQVVGRFGFYLKRLLCVLLLPHARYSLAAFSLFQSF